MLCPAGNGAGQPLVSVLVSFTPVRRRSAASTPVMSGQVRTVADLGERWSALLESVLGATLTSSNLASSAALTCNYTGGGR